MKIEELCSFCERGMEGEMGAMRNEIINQADGHIANIALDLLIFSVIRFSVSKMLHVELSVVPNFCVFKGYGPIVDVKQRVSDTLRDV